MIFIYYRYTTKLYYDRVNFEKLGTKSILIICIYFKIQIFIFCFFFSLETVPIIEARKSFNEISNVLFGKVNYNVAFDAQIRTVIINIRDSSVSRELQK